MKKSTQLNGHPPASSEIALILDRSGSMQAIEASALKGVNTFLSEQQKEGADARFTLILFDDQYEVAIKSRPINEVAPLDRFEPRGSTALLDAIGRTIEKMERSFSQRPPHLQPEGVIVAILTDGLENSSREFTHARVSDLIAAKRAQGWEFLFLAANQDAIASAARLRIDSGQVRSFLMNPISVHEAFHGMSTLTANYRRSRRRPRPEEPPRP